MWPENRKKSTIYPFSHVWLLIHNCLYQIGNGISISLLGTAFEEVQVLYSCVSEILAFLFLKLSEVADHINNCGEGEWKIDSGALHFLGKALQAGWETRRSLGVVLVELRVLRYSISLARAARAGQCSLCPAPNEQGRWRLSQVGMVPFWNCVVCVIQSPCMS